ncbi:MAG: glycosyltransferase family 4 protein [Bryobacteraceae bacterium]|nr:glycosyltransferase family 4 protein [Bryobacteraceae bacterium]
MTMTNDLRVLVYHNRAFPKVGGIETYLLHSLAALRQSAKCLLITHGCPELPFDGVEIITIEYSDILEVIRMIEHGSELSQCGRFLRDSSYASELSAIALVFRPHVLVAHTALNWFIATESMAMEPALPSILHLHDAVCLEGEMAALSRHAMQLADTVVVPSQFLLHAALRHRPHNTPVHIIPGLNEELFPAASPRYSLCDPSAKPEKEVLFPSRLRCEKGVFLALSALEQSLQAGFDWTLTLLVAGAPFETLVWEAIARIDVGRNVRLLTARRHVEMPQLYASYPLVMVPSIHEGFGFTVLEAGLCGVACVTSDAGALPELVRPGVNGFQFPSRNSAALTRAVQSVLTNPGRLANVGRQARRDYLARFDFGRMQNHLIATYRAAADSTRKQD